MCKIMYLFKKISEDKTNIDEKSSLIVSINSSRKQLGLDTIIVFDANKLIKLAKKTAILKLKKLLKDKNFKKKFIKSYGNTFTEKDFYEKQYFRNFKRLGYKVKIRVKCKKKEKK